MHSNWESGEGVVGIRQGAMILVPLERVVMGTDRTRNWLVAFLTAIILIIALAAIYFANRSRRGEQLGRQGHGKP